MIPSIYSVNFPFLCLRRGVSPLNADDPTTKSFSLPTQRCFHLFSYANDIDDLFSAYAEVFPPTQA